MPLDDFGQTQIISPARRAWCHNSDFSVAEMKKERFLQILVEMIFNFKNEPLRPEF